MKDMRERDRDEGAGERRKRDGVLEWLTALIITKAMIP